MITHEQAEAHIRFIGRTCRGQLVLPPVVREFYAQRADSALISGNLEAAVLIKRELEIILGVENKPVGSLPEASQRLVALIYCYADINPSKFGAPCNYDFNNIVVDGPWDGNEHEYTCPKCGQTGKYIAPTFEGVEKN